MKAAGTRTSRPPARMRSYSHNLSCPMMPLLFTGVVEITRFAIRLIWLRFVFGTVRNNWPETLEFMAMLLQRMGCSRHADLNILAAIVVLE